MAYEIGDWVVYPAFGVGRIAGVVTKSFHGVESHSYYEVIGERSTVWVQVDESTSRGLRRLTGKNELAQLREVLRGKPVDLNGDFRVRQAAVRDHLRCGTLQALCEVVRDLSGRGWLRRLSEVELFTLNKSLDAVCREWAAADRVGLTQATAEVNALLEEARLEYRS
jgi:CarD family transcriptional regulator